MLYSIEIQVVEDKNISVIYAKISVSFIVLIVISNKIIFQILKIESIIKMNQKIKKIFRCLNYEKCLNIFYFLSIATFRRFLKL